MGPSLNQSVSQPEIPVEGELQALVEAYERQKKDNSVDFIKLKGAGRVFYAGGDLRMFYALGKSCKGSIILFVYHRMSLFNTNTGGRKKSALKQNENDFLLAFLATSASSEEFSPRRGMYTSSVENTASELRVPLFSRLLSEVHLAIF